MAIYLKTGWLHQVLWNFQFVENPTACTSLKQNLWMRQMEHYDNDLMSLPVLHKHGDKLVSSEEKYSCFVCPGHSTLITAIHQGRLCEHLAHSKREMALRLACYTQNTHVINSTLLIIIGPMFRHLHVNMNGETQSLQFLSKEKTLNCV